MSDLSICRFLESRSDNSEEKRRKNTHENVRPDIGSESLAHLHHVVASSLCCVVLYFVFVII